MPLEATKTMLPSEKNKELWNQVCKTDAAFTRKFDKGTFKGTAVDALANIERLTELLGPVGVGWGWTVISSAYHRYEDPRQDPSTYEVVHCMTIRLWIALNGGTQGTWDACGSTKAVYISSKGKMIVDEDPEKKSLTDALSKGMSYLGCSADVFMGEFDGNKWVVGDRDAARAERQASLPPASSDSGPVIDGKAETAASDDPAGDFIKDMKAILKAIPKMDAKSLVETREGFKKRPSESEPSDWQYLVQQDQALSKKIADAIGKRALNIGLNLKTGEITDPAPE